MSFSVVTNISSLSGQAQLDKTNYGLQQTLARLTSGLPINTAGGKALLAAKAGAWGGEGGTAKFKPCGTNNLKSL